MIKTEYIPWNHHIELARGIRPALRLKDGEPFLAWQSRARAKLAELLGMDKLVPGADDGFEVELELDRGGYTDTRFTFRPEEGVVCVCRLLIPKGEGKIPLFVCLQGHGRGMHISTGEPRFPGDERSIESGRDIAVQAADRGFAALCIEQRCFGERGGTPEPDCRNAAVTAILVGRTLIGERVFDVSRALDVVLARFPRIDSERIACTGNSGGGTTTFYSACIDERIALAVPSCSVCTYLGSIVSIHHCECNYIPRAAEFFDMGDLAGLIAPRPLAVIAGRDDSIFPIDATRENFALIQSCYRAAGVPDRCILAVGEGGHAYYPREAWDAVDRLMAFWGGKKTKN